MTSENLAERCGFRNDEGQECWLAADYTHERHYFDLYSGPADIYEQVRVERERAHAKHGDTSMESSSAHDPVGRRYRVLAEEVGEVAKEFNDAEHDGRPVDLVKLRKELIQVAAMAVAWADACPAGARRKVEWPRPLRPE